jgi:DNA-binding MarR family transcriptional regulator
MSKELIQSISNTFLGLRPLLVSHMIKPLKEIEKCSFPPGYINVMHCLMMKGQEPISMTDLSVAASIAKPNLTIIVDRLIEEEFVERSTDENDRRIVNISLTKDGKDFVIKQKKDFVKFMEERISNFEEEDLIKLKNALEDISEVLGKMEKKDIK